MTTTSVRGALARAFRPAGRVRRLMLILAWILVALVVLGWVGYLYPGESMWTIGLSAFAPYLLALALPAVLTFATTRNWLGVALAAISLVVFVVVQAPLYRAAPAPKGPALVVMTFNMKLGAASARDVVAQVRHRGVDVLMLEELTPTAQQQLIAAGLNRALPFRSSKPFFQARGTGLWSKYRLAEMPWPQLSFNSVAASADIPGLPFKPTLVALHVGGPVPDATSWAEDLHRLPSLLQALPGKSPVIVGGDFNATHSVNQFRALLEGGYRDAGEQAGAGLVRTYPANSWLPPLIGIDHVLTRDAVGTSVETVTIPGSDHRALVATVVLDG